MIKTIQSFLLALVFFSVVSSPLALAQLPASSTPQAPVEVSQGDLHCGLCEAAESHGWGKSTSGKFGRGIVNILLGWTNLFAQPIHVSSSGGNVWNGIGKGFNYFFLRTVEGVTELGTCWLPPAKVEGLTRCTLGDLGITQR